METTKKNNGLEWQFVRIIYAKQILNICLVIWLIGVLISIFFGWLAVLVSSILIPCFEIAVILYGDFFIIPFLKFAIKFMKNKKSQIN